MTRKIKGLCAALLALTFALGAAIPAAAADKNSLAGTVTTSSSPLNVRAYASTGASRITTLKKGSVVTLIEKHGTSWWKVEYADGRYGYCSAEYITPVEGSAAAYVNTSSAKLNVRSGPGFTYSVQTRLDKGEAAVALSRSNGWVRILYDGNKIGYASAEYIALYGNVEVEDLPAKNEPVAPSAVVSYPAVTLAAPYFKQTDSRWASVKLGSSGKTIGKIGCLTCAIAMAESVRSGATVKPNNMASQLQYTSSGAMYWPSRYVTSTASGYLEKIYEKLKEGIPVIVGGKKANGSQHWVLVTGFEVGNSLTTARFTIHDPGNESRTTLQSFFQVYPYFYKIAYYRN